MEDSRKGIDRRHMPPQGIMLLLSYKAKVNPWTHGVNKRPRFRRSGLYMPLGTRCA